jgi:hypothetical protein
MAHSKQEENVMLTEQVATLTTQVAQLQQDALQRDAEHLQHRLTADKELGDAHELTKEEAASELSVQKVLMEELFKEKQQAEMRLNDAGSRVTAMAVELAALRTAMKEVVSKERTRANVHAETVARYEQDRIEMMERVARMSVMTNSMSAGTKQAFEESRGAADGVFHLSHPTVHDDPTELWSKVVHSRAPMDEKIARVQSQADRLATEHEAVLAMFTNASARLRGEGGGGGGGAGGRAGIDGAGNVYGAGNADAFNAAAARSYVNNIGTAGTPAAGQPMHGLAGSFDDDSEPPVEGAAAGGAVHADGGMGAGDGYGFGDQWFENEFVNT